MSQDLGGAAPAWFTRAVACRPERDSVDVDSTRIRYRAWGDRGAPGLVLVHGGGAHSGWWDHIAPQLGGHRVVAPDLSGHGDSDRRPSYDMAAWAREIAAVAAAEELVRPVVVGHSMGGRAAVAAAVEHADMIEAVAYIDTPINRVDREEDGHPQEGRPLRVYPTVEEAVERFRTLPPQETLLPYVRDHIARGSLGPVEGGWSWKFDSAVFRRPPTLQELLPRLTRPTAFLRCEHGLVTPAMEREMVRLVAGPLPVVEIPEAGHHPMLDQPLPLVAALRTLLALWRSGGACPRPVAGHAGSP
jgi:pimeloyl-ACP methyl ester carboxylesterase